MLERQSKKARKSITTHGGKMNYSAEEHEVADYYAQAHAERMLEPTEPHDKGYLLVDDNQVEEPIGFHSVDGAVEYANDYGTWTDYTIYQLKKVL